MLPTCAGGCLSDARFRGRLPAYGVGVDAAALNARIPEPEFAGGEAIAKREQTDRTMAARLMLAFAARFMPKGWRPE